MSAAWRALALSEALGSGVGDGLSAGNRPEALPPGLRVEPVEGSVGAETPGSDPTGSGDVDGVGVVADAVPLMATATEAFGSLGRLAALPMTVSRTDFTDEAESETVALASSCRSTDFASIAPRSQEAVPS